MKVLITGGGGFIGSHLADRLLADGHEVLTVDTYATSRRDNLAPQDRLTIVEGSIADEAFFDRVMEDFRPDAVAHAAASYKDPDAWAEDARTNALGTAIVVKASERVGVKRFVYFQTALCYGVKPEEQPITLSHPLRPYESSYAISKTAGENSIRLSDLDWVSFRLANVYGPRNLSGPLPTFFSRLTQDKACFVTDTRRDFLFVTDLVDVVTKALVDGIGSGAYHVSSGSDVAIKDLFDATTSALGLGQIDVEVRPRAADDAESILLDPSRTEADFSWKTSVSLEDGVAQAIAWYQEHGIEQTYTHLKEEELRVRS
jgi:UDP-glucose 4-epimerase